MLTEEEKEEIIAKATERALLSLPEVVGNLMQNHAAMVKQNRDFYAKYPEFKDHKQVVVEAVEMIDGQDTLIPYESKLEKAIPEIRKRIALMGTLDMKSVSSPKRDFGNGEI